MGQTEETIKRNLILLRKLSDCSITKMAELIGVDYKTLKSIEEAKMLVLLR